MKEIKLLDCTLRDGGHVIGSKFGRDVIVDIVKKLSDSNIDIIEIGFLKNCEFNEDYALFNNVSDVKKIIKFKKPGALYALLVQEDQYDVSKLEESDGFIDIIRVSFHDYDLSEGLACASCIVKKGYKTYINPINLLGYSDSQILDIIEKVNQIHPYAFSIVDTFGSMRTTDLIRIYHLIDHNLDPDITIGLHLHENLSLSYSLAQTFLQISSPTRNISIDGSLYGMGRVPGNLCIELIMEHMNLYYGCNYDTAPVYDAIDSYIAEIKKKTPWGYSCVYALSAQHKVHRTFAEYLSNKETLGMKQINQILSMISKDKATRWNEKYIEELYLKFQNNLIDDSDAINKIEDEVRGRNVVIIAPGKSIVRFTDEIIGNIKQLNAISISANFIWNKHRTDYAFFSNFRRLERFVDTETPPIIITSNLLSEYKSDLAVNYSNYAFENNELFDNCGLMLIKLVSSLHPCAIYLAGFDGFKGEDDFALEHATTSPDSKIKIETNGKMRLAIGKLSEKTKINFITRSLYEKH